MAELLEIMTFYTTKASAILDIGTTYQQVISLETPVLPAGKYIFSYSYELNFNNQKNQPAISQVTGHFAGSEFSDSIGDNDIGDKNRAYSYPFDHPGGLILTGLQFRKPAQFSAQLDVDHIDINIQRVG